MPSQNLPLVSVLYITFNRVDLLEKCLNSFLSNCSYPNLELVVTDDCSDSEIQKKIRALPFDKFVFSEKRTGLGANTNRGINACTGDYILQIQDDFLCIASGGFLEQSVLALEAFSELGFLILSQRIDELPILKTEWVNGSTLIFHKNISKSRQWIYSDWPHLKKRALCATIGRYQEGKNMAHSEINMRDRFNSQNRFYGGTIKDLCPFEHIGADRSFRVPTLRTRLGALRRKLQKCLLDFVVRR